MQSQLYMFDTSAEGHLASLQRSSIILLSPCSPSASVACPQAMPQGGVAYYNCGPDSGASQAHKHLQVVPLPFTPGSLPAAPFDHIMEQACSDTSAGPSGSGADADAEDGAQRSGSAVPLSKPAVPELVLQGA